MLKTKFQYQISFTHSYVHLTSLIHIYSDFTQNRTRSTHSPLSEEHSAPNLHIFHICDNCILCFCSSITGKTSSAFWFLCSVCGWFFTFFVSLCLGFLKGNYNNFAFSESAFDIFCPNVLGEFICCFLLVYQQQTIFVLAAQAKTEKRL
jgi:hypothetical protein